MAPPNAPLTTTARFGAFAAALALVFVVAFGVGSATHSPEQPPAPRPAAPQHDTTGGGAFDAH